MLAATKERVLKEHAAIKAKPENVVRSLLEKITDRPFYNLSKFDLPKLLDDPNQLSPNLNSYINGFSKNVREIMERFAFDQQIARMAEKNLLYEVIKLMVNLLLSPEKDLRRSHVVKTIYDPACGKGGMLSVSENYIRRLNADAKPLLFGQDWNDEAWAVCKSDMLLEYCLFGF